MQTVQALFQICLIFMLQQVIVFGEKNIITDKIKYDYANSCRLDELKCGTDAIYFERENQTILSLKTFKQSLFSPKNTLMVALVTYLITVMFLVLRDLEFD